MIQKASLLESENTGSGTNRSSGGTDNTAKKEIFSSWALFIMIMLLLAALFTSYLLQQKKVEAVHETVISIFAGGNTYQRTSSANKLTQVQE